MITQSSLILVGPAVLALLIIFYNLYPRSLPLPPGPPAKLWSGVVQLIPKTEFWKVYSQWGKEYGPIVYFRIFTQKYVVLNTAKVVVDLLEHRSNIYSDRPTKWMGIVLTGRTLAAFNISSQNPRHRLYRRQMHTGLNPRATENYQHLIEQETHTFLDGLLESPRDLIHHIRRNAGAVILKITYGWKVTKNDDYFVDLMQEAVAQSKEVMEPGRWLVDTLPWLRFVPTWFPGAGFRRKAAHIKERMSNIDTIPFQWVKDQMKSGDYIDSFTSMGLRPESDQVLSEEQEDILKWCSAALYAGGADTTVSAITTFFLCMTLHPEVQARAQAEVESVVDKNRLPNCHDQNNLPYTMALIKEVLRWAPVAPLGLPHRVTQEDYYEGYRIPKGTTIFANIWSIMHDPAMYPNPFNFDPTRFFPVPGVEPQVDPRKWAFGFGRRVCPGAHFAETSLFLNIASVLATFNISKAVDNAGKDIEPRVSYTTGITSHPMEFDFRITPRSPNLLAAVKGT